MQSQVNFTCQEHEYPEMFAVVTDNSDAALQVHVRAALLPQAFHWKTPWIGCHAAGISEHTSFVIRLTAGMYEWPASYTAPA